MFTLGCVLAELHLGRSLFPYTSSIVARLAAVERVLGRIPADIARKARGRLPSLFTENADATFCLNFPRRNAKDAAERQKVRSLMPMKVSMRKILENTCISTYRYTQGCRQGPSCAASMRTAPRHRSSSSYCDVSCVADVGYMKSTNSRKYCARRRDRYRYLNHHTKSLRLVRYDIRYTTIYKSE